LNYYGMIAGTVDVKQSVLVDGGNYLQPNTYNGSLVAGSTIVSAHTLYNQAEVPATVKFETSYDPEPIPEEEYGITTTYWEPVEYTKTVTTSDPMSIPATITVEDIGDSMEWTIDIDMDNAPISNGHIAYALVISRDNVHPAFQVHSNDGTDALYDWGTHLYSEWGPEGTGYHGWHTGWDGTGDRTANNVPVDDIEGVTATGERDVSVNTEGVFTVTISKDMLGPEFSWAVQIMADTSDTHYPEAWTPWSGDASEFEKAILAEELPEELTLQPGDTLDFVIVNHFDVALVPGTYTITTRVVPVTPTPT